MLIQFSVENFKSFKDKAMLSMEYPENGQENVGKKAWEGVLPFVSIFGANASGKSNIFKAITAAILCIRNCTSLQTNQLIEWIEPFAFDSHKAERPSVFEFVFLTKGKKYIYGFSATKEMVYGEYLYRAGKKTNRKIFVREHEKYCFSSTYRDKLGSFVDKTDKNKLFLAVATIWNCEITKEPYEWLQRGIDTYDPSFMQPIPSEYFGDSTPNLKQMALGLLRTADINLSDYSVEKSFAPMPMGGFYVKAKMSHNYFDDSGKMQVGVLDFSQESQGTQYMFALIPTIEKAFEEGKTLCFDEFDAHLHPILLRYLVELFMNPRHNKQHGQLIISAHSMALLTKKFLNCYQIYFVEKNRKNLGSELYSLDEFSIDKCDNILKMYLDGRYGAVPDIWEYGDNE